MTEKTTKKKTSKKTKTTPPSVAEEVKDDATPTKQQPKEEEHATTTTTTTPSSAVKKLPQITVARLLNETQLGVAVHKRIVRQMTELRHVNGNETFLQEMCTCLLHVLLEYKVLIRLSSSSSLFVFISSSVSSSFESDFENEIQKNFSFVPLFVSLDFKSIRMNKTLIILLL